MTEVVSVRFKSGRKSYFFDPVDYNIDPGDRVIVETSKGLEFGECLKGNYMVNDDRIVPPLRPVIRLATDEDIDLVKKNEDKETRAYDICATKIKEHNLEMKLVDVEYNFEGNKILFFFTADGRVDFRGLVKDLAAIFRTRIELRQIGVRDEAKMLGGLGICGKPFCCNQFMDEFQPVSIKMAKTQALSLNPTKISGTCGRLMCCLQYEQEAYEGLVKNAPKLDSYVQTPEGNGTITDVNLLHQRVKVRLDGKSGDAVIGTFPMSEIAFIKTGKQHRADMVGDSEKREEKNGKEELPTRDDPPMRHAKRHKPPKSAQSEKTKQDPGKRLPTQQKKKFSQPTESAGKPINRRPRKSVRPGKSPRAAQERPGKE